MLDSRPSPLLSIVVTFSVAILWCVLRLWVFGDSVLPLTFVLPLMICVWSRRAWQLWAMAAIFVVTAVVKSVWILPSEALTGPDDAAFLAGTLFNIVIGCIAVRLIMRLRDRLEQAHSIVTAQNSELEAQSEELSQQNEEIRAQNEELAEQNEEIEAQTEEVVRQNEELVEVNKRLNSREEILQGLLDSARNPVSAEQMLGSLCRRTLAVVGEPACAVAVLTQDNDAMLLQAQATTPEMGELPKVWTLENSVCQLVLEADRTAYVSDLSKRPDLASPFGPQGAVRSILATPVRISAAPGGTLVICSRDEAHWTEEQFRMVEWVAAQASLVVETRRWQNLLSQRAHEVEQASRAKDNFLAALSHELRMPLTPILMTAAALREDESLSEDIRAQLGMIERNIALEARLIDDLLDLTRIAKGKLPLRPQLCDAHSLISLAMEIVRDDANEKGLVLERDFSARKSGLVADPSRFQQVIWNLLRNAVKFTPAGGRISIRTSDESDADDGPKLRIEVADTGIGIDREALDGIFEPFEQGAVSGDHRYGGLGLGLAIARAIVDLHHGTIAAESSGRDQGSTFVVELPGATEPPTGMVAPGTGAVDGQPTALAEAAPTLPLRILLVEDHEPTLQVLSRLLMRAGYHVTAVSTITAAQTEAAAHPFDLVISDLGLPDGSGNELMERLRDRHGLRGIALSGYGMEEDVERSRKAGFLAHLVKPVDINQLRRAVTSVSTAPSHSGEPADADDPPLR